MRRLAVVLSSLLVGATLAATPHAAAAASTQIGNGCVASDYDTNATFLVVGAAPGNPLPAAATTTGVITKATLVLPGEADDGPYPVKLKTVRNAATPGQYTVVSESTVINTTAGVNSAAVRVPIKAGDRLGLGGAGALICATPNAADTLAVYDGDLLPGASAAPLETAGNASLPVVATIEPDADKDGFGDVTQDQCPQSATTTAACPRVKLDSIAFGQDGSVLVLVGTSGPAKVKVAGAAKVGGKTVAFRAVTKRLKPGKLGRYTMALPAELRAALARLPRTRSISVTFTASAKNVTGRASKDTAKVKLPGTRR